MIANVQSQTNPPSTTQEYEALLKVRARERIEFSVIDTIKETGNFTPVPDRARLSSISKNYKILGELEKSYAYLQLAVAFGCKTAKTDLQQFKKEHPSKKGWKKRSKEELKAFVLADLQPIFEKVRPEIERANAEERRAFEEMKKAYLQGVEEKKRADELAPLENVDALARSAWDQFVSLTLECSRQFISTVPSGSPSYISNKMPSLSHSSRQPSVADAIINIPSPGALSLEPASQMKREADPFAVVLDSASLKQKVEKDFDKYRRKGLPGPGQEGEDHKHAADVRRVVRSALSYAEKKGIHPAALLAGAYPELPVRRKPICRNLATGEVYSPYNNALTDGSLFTAALKINSLFSQFTAAVIGGRPSSTTECSILTTSRWPDPIPGISLERCEQLSRLEKPGKILASFIEELLTVTVVNSWAYLYKTDRGPGGGFMPGTYEARIPQYNDFISCAGSERLSVTEANIGVAIKVPLLSLTLLKNAKLPNLGDLSGLPAKDVIATAAGVISDGAEAHLVTATLLYLNMKSKSPDSIIWIGNSTIRENVNRISKMPFSETRELLIKLFAEGPLSELLLQIWQISR